MDMHTQVPGVDDDYKAEGTALLLNTIGAADAFATTHPEYTEFAGERGWKFWANSEIGGKKFSEANYLIEHPREKAENAEMFAYRKKFAVYESSGREVATDWVARLFGPGTDISLYSPDEKDKVNRDFYLDLTRNIDLLGTDLYNFLKSLIYKSLTLGMQGCVIDVRRSNTPIVTMLDAERSGVRPFLRSVSPENILDWEWDDEFQLEWVKIREPYNIKRRWNDGNQIGTQGTATYKYYILDKQRISIYYPEEKGKFKEEIVSHDLGVVPFVRFYWMTPEPGKMFVPPIIEEIYDIQFLIYQLFSGLCEIMLNQMFSIFVIATATSRRDERKELHVGDTRAMLVSGSEGFAPFFASPDPQLPLSHLQVIDHLYTRIKMLSKGVGITTVDQGSSEKSGRSKAYDVDSMTNLLRCAGDTIEPQLLQVMQLLHKRSRYASSPFTGRAKFPDDHILRGVLEEAEEAVAVCNVLAESPTALQAKKRKFASTTLRGECTDDVMTKIMDEIKGTPIVDPTKESDDGPSDRSSKDRQAGRARASGEQSGPSIKRSGSGTGAGKGGSS
jgi:hypothetical protein